MKQQLTEALEELSNRPGAPWAEVDPSIAEAIAAAHLVERLLPGECECWCHQSDNDGDTCDLTRPCFQCETMDGQVWDEGIVEVVERAVEVAWDGWKMYPSYVPEQVARAVLSAIAQLAEAGSQAVSDPTKTDPPKDPWDYDP